MPPGVPGRHFMCRLRGRDVAAVASRPGTAPAVTAWNTYVWVESADAAVAAATGAGGGVVVEPFESLDGGRIAVVADPAGATTASGSRVRTGARSSSTSPEPGR
jgi:hypothetical protein